MFRRQQFNMQFSLYTDITKLNLYNEKGVQKKSPLYTFPYICSALSMS